MKIKFVCIGFVIILVMSTAVSLQAKQEKSWFQRLFGTTQQEQTKEDITVPQDREITIQNLQVRGRHIIPPALQLCSSDLDQNYGEMEYDVFLQDVYLKEVAGELENYSYIRIGGKASIANLFLPFDKAFMVKVSYGDYTRMLCFSSSEITSPNQGGTYSHYWHMLIPSEELKSASGDFMPLKITLDPLRKINDSFRRNNIVQCSSVIKGSDTSASFETYSSGGTGVNMAYQGICEYKPYNCRRDTPSACVDYFEHLDEPEVDETPQEPDEMAEPVE